MYCIGDRADVRNIAVIITDGESTQEREELDNEAKQLKDAEVFSIAIGIGSGYSFSQKECK